MAEETSSKKRVAAVVALWAAVMGGVTFVSACYGHVCDGDFLVYGRDPGEGQLIDPDTWQTGPIDARWIDFPHQRAYLLDLHDLGDRVPYRVTPYVSAQADPLHDPGGNFTLAAGNLTEIYEPGKGRISVKNDTCADYFLRVVVEVPPRPPAASNPTPIPDAGGDSEAGP